MLWDVSTGYRPAVDEAACTRCEACLAVCPGEHFDVGAAAPWREWFGDAPEEDFLGPWRGLWFGWAADGAVRHEGASGGVATALLQMLLRQGPPGPDGSPSPPLDAVICTRMSREQPLAAEAVLAASPEQVAACHGSKYSSVAVSTLLAHVRRTPGRYAFVGLPCHIQGLRLAQLRSSVLRERVVVALGIFCGLTSEPRATQIAARRAGLAPEELSLVSYRGPGWPGEMRLETRTGLGRRRRYPDYFDRFMAACAPARCRLCPDALAELADVSVGDAWLARFEDDPVMADGVSDVIARTDLGLRLVRGLIPETLALEEASLAEMLASQSETYRVKRPVMRGRRWLRQVAGRPVPDYPGLDLHASLHDRVAGVRDLAEETLFRTLGDLRYR